MALSVTRKPYIIKALGRDHEILAWDVEDAYRTVSRMLQRQHPMPTDNGQTYWLPCRMYDAVTGRLLQAWSEPISWPGEISPEYETSTYYLFAGEDGFANEFIASDNDEAVRRGHALLRALYGPNRSFEARFLGARIEDAAGSIIYEWTETLEAEPPDCDAPIPELAEVSTKALGLILGFDAREEDGHVWAPFAAESGAVCARCGTLRTAEGYEPGRFAAAVVELWRADNPE